MIHKRALFLFILALVLAAPVAVGSIERAVEPSGNGLDITLTFVEEEGYAILGRFCGAEDFCTWMFENLEFYKWGL